MLCSIGPINFEIAPLSLLSIDESGEEDYAVKSVVGGPLRYEHMGRGDESFRLSARVFPERFGGLGSLEALDSIRRSGVPQMMVRGDGKVHGFVIVRRIDRRASYLDVRGVGRMIDVDITLTRASAPSPAAAFAQLFSLFA